MEVLGLGYKFNVPGGDFAGDGHGGLEKCHLVRKNEEKRRDVN